MIRVDDAAVSTVRYVYNFDVHNNLVGLASRNWGQDTRTLGFDYRKWKEWYELTFKPYWDRKMMEAVKQHVRDNTAPATAAPQPAPAQEAMPK
jgi:hypothetical protein